MKYKNAIRLIQNDDLSGDDLFRRVADMFCIEADGRIELRMGKNKKPSANLVRGVVEEMKQWITKVAEGVGLPEESLKTLIDTESGVIYSEWHVQDPRVTNIQRRVRGGLVRGEAPIQNLRMGDIKALADAAVGNMIAEVRSLSSGEVPMAREDRREEFLAAPEEAIHQIAVSQEYQDLLGTHGVCKTNSSRENASREYRCYQAVRKLFFTALEQDMERKKALFLSGQMIVRNGAEAEKLGIQLYENTLVAAREHIPLFAAIYDMLQKAKTEGKL